MSSDRACPECSRRGILLAGLAGHVERSVGSRAGERARDLLALPDDRLAAAVAPDDWRRRLREASTAAADAEPTASVEGGWSTCIHSGGLPDSLAALGRSRPRALFGSGDLPLLSGLEPSRAVTIVGSRRGGPYGRQVAFDLARMLAAAGIVVVSGLAMGIDSAAHEGALTAGGPTIAVLGPGADRAYPRSAHRLYGEVRSKGTVISELPPRTPTFRWMFPARNRLMAALADVTVVVEAAERSGSLITAEMAVECGRSVGAVPGPVTSWRSSGTNRLLAEGAFVARDARDILDVLLGPGAVLPPAAGPPLPADAEAVLGAVESGATTPDAVAAGSGVGFSDTLRTLAGLERDGYLSCDHAGRWSRTTQATPGDGGERDAVA